MKYVNYVYTISAMSYVGGAILQACFTGFLYTESPYDVSSDNRDDLKKRLTDYGLQRYPLSEGWTRHKHTVVVVETNENFYW